MLAAWYDRNGSAREVLQVGELPDPEPRAGEVRVRVHVSGVNPGDIKKREGWLGSTMPYSRVVPHSDAAGVIDSVGAGVDTARAGQRIWVHGAQSYRAFGTAAEYCTVPADLAVPLPPEVSDEIGACLGIPGTTAHRAVFGDGPVQATIVLVHGVLGAVGSLAAQLAVRGGATVIGTVRRSSDLDDPAAAATHLVALDRPDPAEAIRAHAPEGVDRIVEVSLSGNADLDTAVARPGATIAAYATGAADTTIPFWPMLFANLTVRLLGSDDFPAEVKHRAARDLTELARTDPVIPIAARYPLRDIAAAHERIDGPGHGRVLVDIPG
ncbi:NADPH:quinone reductase [Nocardia sp. NBC_00416]|uniref:NADPH:quinone reductase n=1 Tax=Nocardia sp. NBC_00416 TaxID=2975991 RepID=UPI002E1FA0D1